MRRRWAWAQLADLPGTVRYFLRSAPEMLEEALAMNWNDFAKQLDLLRLVRPGAGSAGT